MSKYDWYQRTTWSEEDQADFWMRWKRCRGLRAQYLKIQGSVLAQSESIELVHAAIGLLKKVIDDYPDDLSETSGARSNLGFALGRIGQHDAALQCFRDAVNAEIANGDKLRTGADINFVFFVVVHDLTDQFDEALEMLEVFYQRNKALVSHQDRFKACAATALIAAHQGSADEARRAAEVALESAMSETSGLSRHPTVGLVPADREPYAIVVTRLQELV